MLVESFNIIGKILHAHPADLRKRSLFDVFGKHYSIFNKDKKGLNVETWLLLSEQCYSCANRVKENAGRRGKTGAV